MKFGIRFLLGLLAAAHSATACIKYQVWNADTNSPTGIFLEPGNNIYSLTSYEVNIEADFSSCPYREENLKVRLMLDGPVRKTKWESRAPYTLFGDKDSNPENIRVNGKLLLPGEYGLSVSVHENDGVGQNVPRFHGEWFLFYVDDAST